MSYSRWSNSRWYTFHTAFSGKTKESQAFEIMMDFARSRIFTYAELKSDIDKCLREVGDLCGDSVECDMPEEISVNESLDFGDTSPLKYKLVYKKEMLPPDPVTVEELDELRVYMENFITDVEFDYSLIGRFADFLSLKGVFSVFGNFGWRLVYKIKPKRKKYAGSSRRKV